MKHVQLNAGNYMYLFVAVHCKSRTQSISLKRKKNQSRDYFFSVPPFR